MIILECCLVVLALEAIVLRGRLARLASLRLHRFWLVWFALLDQIVVISILPGRWHAVLAVANYASYVAAAAFVFFNRKVPGVLFVATGGALNMAAILANHGTMPASATALKASGWHAAAGHFVNSGVVSHPRLSFLGDIFDVPRWLPGHDVFSVGDLLIVLGIAVLIFRTCTAPVTAGAPEDAAPEGEAGASATGPDLATATATPSAGAA